MREEREDRSALMELFSSARFAEVTFKVRDKTLDRSHCCLELISQRTSHSLCRHQGPSHLTRTDGEWGVGVGVGPCRSCRAPARPIPVCLPLSTPHRLNAGAGSKGDMH
jgi:hypothetical protein